MEAWHAVFLAKKKNSLKGSDKQFENLIFVFCACIKIILVVFVCGALKLTNVPFRMHFCFKHRIPHIAS